MSLFDSASLVVTPNGYKEDKLYSIKPTDGSGDLVVTRATTATRVNSDGLIEQVPYNLLTYSQDFDNAAWTKIACSITANSTTAPDGTSTADSLIENTANDAHYIDIRPTVINVNNTVSIYVKANGRNKFQIREGSNGDLSAFDLANPTGNIESVGNGWYRVFLTTTPASTTFIFQLRLLDNSGNLVYTGNGTSGLYIWGAQLVSGTSAKEYFPTTDRLNVPRLDYTNSSCPSILVEPQRTNVVLYSQQFDNAYWTKQNASIVINSTTSPDGTLNASKLVEDTANSRHYINATNTIVTATQQTASIYIKAAGRTKFALSEEVATGAYASFNLANGTVLDQNGISAKITALTNGWFKCEYTINSTIFFLLRIVLLPNSYTSGGVNGTYIGDGTSGVFLYGAQLEQGSYATSYIPTVASSVTRNADVISKTGISSLIGQTEGTFFLDLYASAKNKDGGSFATWFIAGDVTNNFQIYNLGSNLYWFARNTAGGIFLDQLANQTIVEGTRYKIAIAYKSGDYALYINGIQKRTNTNTNIPTVSQFNLSTEGFGSSPAIVKNEYNSVQFYKTRLTNSELASLTTI